MLETWVRSLGREDPLEKEMATHSSTLALHGGRNLVGYSPWGRKESDMTEQLHSLILMCGLPGWLSGKESPAMQEPQEIQVQSLC